MYTLSAIVAWCTSFIGVAIKALLVYLIGKAVINRFLGLLEKHEGLGKMDKTASSFARNAIKWMLYALLAVIIISILGIPTASVITVLASAGVAVGMAMQGSLSNLAGGIMLLIFRPFNIGDYITAGGAEGTVTEITILYTVLTTVDNKKIMVPNGSMMASNVVNFSQETRRCDLSFSVAKGTEVAKVKTILMTAMLENKMVLQNPEPAAVFTGGEKDTMDFQARAWCKGSDYWTLYFELLNTIADKFAEEGIEAPAIRVIQETK